MALLEQVLVNGTNIPTEHGLEGRIASAIERNGAHSCVIVQVSIGGKSYSFAFPAGCAGTGGGGGAGVRPAELDRLEKTYLRALEKLDESPASIRGAVIGFINSL